MKIGFTGTQRGMTPAQKTSFEALIQELRLTEFHHGDCIGADQDAHDIVVRRDVWVVLHPPTVIDKRAFCVGNEKRVPKWYLERNHDIVDETDVLIAAPGEDVEQLRSGTWATVRYARKLRRTVYLLYPDGRALIEMTKLGRKEFR